MPDADSNIMMEYFRGTHVFLVVYDVTNPESFYNTIKYLHLIDRPRFMGQPRANRRKILVGNKSDLSRNRVIRTKQGKDFADKTPGMQFFETSAKASTNVEEIFLSQTRQLVRICEESRIQHEKRQAERSCKMAS